MSLINRNVLIAGAGIAGPSLAGWLLRYGFRPTLIECAPSFREGGYMIDIWGTGYDLIERYGLLETVKEHVYVFDRLKFVNAEGKQLSGFGSNVFQRALAGQFFSIPRRDLAHALYYPIRNDVETEFSTSIKTMREDDAGVDVEFSTGWRRRFDIVIGADGLRSQIRRLTFGDDTKFEKYLGYCAASFIADNYPRRDPATYVSFARPGRQISRYAMRENRTAFLFVFAHDQRPQLRAQNLRAQKALLRSTFSDDGWETPEILAQLDKTEELYFDAVSQIRMPQWYRKRIALVGDAAYCPSLLAGAGSAFAMLGAYILAGELRDAEGDHEKAFGAYETRLKGFMSRQQETAVRLASSFTPKSDLGILVRNWIVNLMNAPVLGQWLINRMLGHVFPLPNYGQ